MEKEFNITGTCLPKRHYMVDLSDRLGEIKKMIDKGYYFSINRGRQYGKTTTLYAIRQTLKEDYVVISLDFQKMDTARFKDASLFTKYLCEIILSAIKYSKENRIDESVLKKLSDFRNSTEEKTIGDFSNLIPELCLGAQVPIVLLIDEVDSASNYEVFVDFLAALRLAYLDRDETPTFQSVILAGVWDIRHLKQKIRPDSQHKINSPWNIAAEFKVRMWFNAEEIAGMLRQYEEDHHSGMNIEEISQKIFDYTQGYPVMVSWLCKRMAEDLDGVFTKESLAEAVKMMLNSRDVAVFGSMMHQIDDNENLRTLLQNLVFRGQTITYNPDDKTIGLGIMFSYLRQQDTKCVMANWLFEQRLFRYFVSQEMMAGESSRAYEAGGIARNQFIMDDRRLNMDLVMSKFVAYFSDIYNSKDTEFVEKMGRKLFMLYLKPIINGTGNYYIEAETRDETRTDLVVDCGGEQFVVEMKIWHGDEYKERGERQLRSYLNYFHIDKGYLLSFSFNKNKKVGLSTIMIDGKTIVEATV